MRDFRDAKAMATTLREALHAKSVTFTIQATQSFATSAQASTPFPTGSDIPIVPIRDMVLFPHMISRIFVARDKTRQAVEHALAGDRRVVVVAERRVTDDRPGTLDALHSVGVIANVIDRQTQVDGALKVTVCGLQRTGIIRITHGAFMAAEVAPIEEQGGQSTEAATLSNVALDAYQTYAEVDFSALPPGSKARFGLPSIGDPGLLADTVAPLLSTSIEQKQQLLEASDVVVRLERLIELMNAGRPKAVA